MCIGNYDVFVIIINYHVIFIPMLSIITIISKEERLHKVDEVVKLLERRAICPPSGSQRCHQALSCQLFIADLWKSDPNMATGSPIFPIHSCQLFVTKSDPNMALNVIISTEYTYRHILLFVCCYKNSLLLLWSLDYKCQTKALLDCPTLIGIDDDEKGVSDPALWSVPSVWLYICDLASQDGLDG